MKNKDLIPRRRVLGLGVALAGLCAGCAVLPAGSTAVSYTHLTLPTTPYV